MQGRTLGRLTAATWLSLSLAACGGGGSQPQVGAPSGNSPPVIVPEDAPPEQVSGIALPSSVAVVTATNAN